MANIQRLWKKVRYRVYHRAAYIYYDLDLPAVGIAEDSDRIDVDRAIALDAPIPPGSPRESPSFAERVAEREAGGSHFYTASIDGELAHWGWLTPFEREHELKSAGAVLVTDGPGVMLVDFHTENAFRRRGLYSENIRKMLHDAAAAGASRAFIATRTTNIPSRRAIEGIGFRPFREYTRTRVLAHSRTRVRDLS